MGYIPISQSLPHTSLASLQSGGLAGRNLGQELAIPAKLGDKRTVEELNMILVNILVSSGPNGGHHLRTFRAIQWECECELYRDRGRPKGSLLSIHGQQLRLARAGGLSKQWRLPLAPPRSRRPAPCRRSRSHRARRARCDNFAYDFASTVATEPDLPKTNFTAIFLNCWASSMATLWAWRVHLGFVRTSPAGGE